jgi:hypothetical protein
VPRHKTAHRKARAAHEKQTAAARDALLKESKNDPTLKANAHKSAKRFK